MINKIIKLCMTNDIIKLCMTNKINNHFHIVKLWFLDLKKYTIQGSLNLSFCQNSKPLVTFKSLIEIDNGFCHTDYSGLCFLPVFFSSHLIKDGRNVALPVGCYWGTIPFSGIICLHCDLQQSFDEQSWLPFW